MQKKVWLGFIVLYALISPLYGQTQKRQWVDSVFNTLTLDGKIGQILMLPVNSYSDKQALEKTATQIKKYKIGGIVFTKGGPISQVNVTNYFQHQAAVPLLVGMNAEEGLGSVLDSTLRFPSPIMLGSVRDDSLLFFLGSEIGKQLKELGVHINFAPTSDLNAFDNGKNLSMNTYGENLSKVASKVVAYQTGMKTTHILSVAKRSPNYGLVVKDVQIGIQQSQDLNQSIEPPADSNRLLPLTQLIKNGSDGVITTYEPGHAFSGERKVFSTTSTIISGAMPMIYSGGNLKRQLKFDGLIFGFIPDLQLKKTFKTGDAEALLFRAGNDVLLFPKSITGTVRKLRKLIRKDNMLQKQLDESVKKILAAKFDAGLNHRKMISKQNLLDRINTPISIALQSALYERSVTVVKDDEHVLPVKQLDNVSFASLSIGNRKENLLSSHLSRYTSFAHYGLQVADDTVGLVEQLARYDVVVVAIFPTSTEIESIYQTFLQKLGSKTKVVAVELGSITNLHGIEKLPTLIQAHTDQAQIQQFIPQLIFGAKMADGILPVSVDERIREGQGVQTSLLGRMGYSTPEAEGFDVKTMDKIQKIAHEAIDQKATPGCQIVVARHGKVVYEKYFGWQTYDQSIPVDDQTIYDLASITKIAATLPIDMFLYEKGMIDIYKKASYYLPELVNSNKKDITIKEILTHQAGLIPFIPFWTQTVKDSVFLPEYYSKTKDELHTLQVAPNLFAISSLRDSLWKWSIQSKLREKAPRTPYNYVYSDIGLYIMHHINERLLNQPQDEFLQQNLYEPMGITTMGYLPLQRFNRDRIAPTENDRIFRKEVLIGTVHDEGAALSGGIAGHAGLFSNATDLAKYGQMLLQKGYYGGQQYFKPETVNYFTTKQFEPSRRGLGWDKPMLSEWNTPTSSYASGKTFGHTGFTGTCIWVDPEFDMVYIFLSNARFPSRSSKLISLNIRSRIQDVLYQAIFNYSQYGSNYPDDKLIQYLKRINN